MPKPTWSCWKFDKPSSHSARPEWGRRRCRSCKSFRSRRTEIVKDGFMQEFFQDFRENICKNLPQIKSEKICRDVLERWRRWEAVICLRILTSLLLRGTLLTSFTFILNYVLLTSLLLTMLLTSLLLRGIFLIWRIRRAKHSFFGLYLENHAIY